MLTVLHAAYAENRSPPKAAILPVYKHISVYIIQLIIINWVRHTEKAVCRINQQTQVPSQNVQSTNVAAQSGEIALPV